MKKADKILKSANHNALLIKAHQNISDQNPEILKVHPDFQ